MPSLRLISLGKIKNCFTFLYKHEKKTSKKLKNIQCCIFAIPEIRNIPEKKHVWKSSKTFSLSLQRNACIREAIKAILRFFFYQIESFHLIYLESCFNIYIAMTCKQKSKLTPESMSWLYLAMSRCKVLHILVAIIPDKNNTITNEFKIL